MLGSHYVPHLSHFTWSRLGGHQGPRGPGPPAQPRTCRGSPAAPLGGSGGRGWEASWPRAGEAAGGHARDGYLGMAGRPSSVSASRGLPSGVSANRPGSAGPGEFPLLPPEPLISRAPRGGQAPAGPRRRLPPTQPGGCTGRGGGLPGVGLVPHRDRQGPVSVPPAPFLCPHSRGSGFGALEPEALSTEHRTEGARPRPAGTRSSGLSEGGVPGAGGQLQDFPPDLGSGSSEQQTARWVGALWSACRSQASGVLLGNPVSGHSSRSPGG